MAKKKKLNIANFAYIFLTLMALQFLALVVLMVGQVFMGNLRPRDLMAMLFVLRGSHKYVEDNNTYRRFQEFQEAEKEHWERVREVHGSEQTQFDAKQAAEERIKVFEEKAQAMRSLLEKEKQELERMRQVIEAQKAELDEVRASISAERKAEAARIADEKTEKLIKTLAGMDAAQLGAYFSELMRRNPQQGPLEVAKVMHGYMSGTRIAEVMEEMTDEDRQKILPVLENKYAGSLPEDIAREWTRQNIDPEVMAIHVRKMLAEKAFRILPHLDPAQKSKLVQILQTPPR